ncbi:MAG: NAD-dependent epimerase/dehydratase family protein [Chloroherpetonaceae bacterium]|nr:NAD-dependent epimerase/dehydratase family protein [Chthonomonadaceae bacterium]MDW8206739.1 NAD-dependent epimerase/dehydratase family protein [Chloroherpetonaceae bacterium]
MRVLIIGGTGLISSAITPRLLERGDAVTLYNRGQSEVRFPGTPVFLHGDRRDYATFEAQMAEAGTFDCVIDMVGYVPEDAESVVRAFRGRIGQFLFCSTACVYGGPAQRYPIREDEPRRPTGTYGANKARIEDILMQAHERGDFAVTILRPSQTYGEGGTIVHSLGWSTTYIDRIRKGKPVIVHGDGQSLWAACHIDDVAQGFIGAMGNPKAYGRCYNLTGEEWMTWNQYHEGVAAALNAPPPGLVHIPTDLLGRLAPRRASISVEIFQYPGIFDNQAAMQDLGFRYTVPWVEGVRRTVAWLDARGRIASSDEDPFDDRILAAWEHMTSRMAEDLRDLES